MSETQTDPTTDAMLAILKGRGYKVHLEIDDFFAIVRATRPRPDMLDDVSALVTDYEVCDRTLWCALMKAIEATIPEESAR